MVRAMRSRTLAAALPILATVLLAACGGSDGGSDVASLSGDDDGGGSTSTTLSEEQAEEALLDWAACMREQGLDVPDPQVDGKGRVQIGIGGGGDADDEGGGGDDGAPPDRDAFEAAREECGDPPMVGGEISEEDREEMQQQALELAECMRDEGIEDFPDPDFSDMGPGSGPRTRQERVDDDDDAGAGGDDGPSVMIAGPFGQIDLDDPEIRAAFETCADKVGMDAPRVASERPAAASGSS